MPTARLARRRQTQDDQTARAAGHCDEMVYPRYADSIALLTPLPLGDADVMRRGDPVGRRGAGSTFPCRQGMDDALGIGEDLVRTATAPAGLRDLFQLTERLKSTLNKFEIWSNGFELVG